MDRCSHAETFIDAIYRFFQHHYVLYDVIQHVRMTRIDHDGKLGSEV